MEPVANLVYSVLFSVLPTVQSFLAQLLGKAVALTIIIGDFIWTWASHEQNNRETCFIHLYKAIQINEWDNIMIINDWKKINKFLAETNFGSCAYVYILMPSMLIILQIKQVTWSIKLKQSILLVERPVVLGRGFLWVFTLCG